MPAEVFPSVRILRSSASVLRTTSERDTRSGPRSPPRASSPWHDAHAVSKAALASMRLTAFVLDAVLPGLFCALRRSEEHTSELQSRLHLVCRLLLEKKKNTRRLVNSAMTIGKRAPPLPQPLTARVVSATARAVLNIDSATPAVHDDLDTQASLRLMSS